MQSCIILFQSSPVTIRKSIATPVTGDSKLARLNNKRLLKLYYAKDAYDILLFTLNVDPILFQEYVILPPYTFTILYGPKNDCAC